MKFIVIMSQGNGCDYTIGCGIAYSFYEASNAQDAFQQWTKNRELDNPSEPYMIDYYGPGGEGELDNVEVYQLADEEDNEHLWPNFLKKQQAAIKTQNQKSATDAERAELERLKKKFGEK